ncbi:IS3 family transposase [Planococcus salinarum]|uniref:IS3 family transposase n=1 Tax=Planococcus salinarum TaxID=622695 RepID=UPI000E3CD968|nr:IS3 family transposase [Planococcus salinarum]TAA68729.1 IS3 family transposase [Planococcus salinarum]
MAFELQKEGFRLTDVLEIVDLPEATYHYHRQRFGLEDPNLEWETLILELFEKHEGRYGYRRIHLELKAQGYVINHKKVQRIMGELNLTCIKFIRKSRYRSYKGQVGTIAKNRLNRRFHTSHALQKIVTDVTEFKCMGEEKLYLSPVMDLYNGEIICMSMSKRPTLDFVLDSLHHALPIIGDQAAYRTTIHSDQGWHYQHRLWVKSLKQHRIFQSMSRKATCADNAAMENFFGLLKQEMYHGEELVSYEELKLKIERYVHYYNHERIKQKLAGMSPVNYRIHASQLAA